MVDERPDDDSQALRRAPGQDRDHPSDVAAIADDSGETPALEHDLDPRRAYEVLEIRTPLEEFEAYVKARIDTLMKLGDNAKAALTGEALELGRRSLGRVTGVSSGAAEPARGARS